MSIYDWPEHQTPLSKKLIANLPILSLNDQQLKALQEVVAEIEQMADAKPNQPINKDNPNNPNPNPQPQPTPA